MTCVSGQPLPKAMCPKDICLSSTYSRNTTFVDLGGWLTTYVPEQCYTLPSASGQPLPSCEARNQGTSVPPKLYSWPSRLILVTNSPPHPTPKGWGGELVTAPLVIRRTIRIGYPWARGVKDVILTTKHVWGIAHFNSVRVIRA